MSKSAKALFVVTLSIFMMSGCLANDKVVKEQKGKSQLQEDFVYVPPVKTIEQLKKERNDLQMLYYLRDYTKEEYEELYSCKLLDLDDYPYPFEPIFIDEAMHEGEALEIVQTINGFFKARQIADYDEMDKYVSATSALRQENFMKPKELATVELVSYETSFDFEGLYGEEIKNVYIATRDREIDCTKEDLYYLRYEDGMWKFYWSF